MKSQVRSSWLALAFAFVTLAFVASSVVAQWSAREVTIHARSLERNALPSVERLTSARAHLRHLATAVENASASPMDVVAPLHDVDEDIDAYLALPAYPGEPEIFEKTVRPSLDRMQQGLTSLGGTSARAAPRTADVLRAIDAADDGLRQLVVFNTAQAQGLATRIVTVRKRSMRLATALDAASGVFAVAAAALVVRGVRRQTRSLTARADELDSFASRVAHDLMSPLAAVHLSLSAIERRHADDPTRRDIARATRSLDRSRLVVGSIYEFARAGGVVPPGARAPLVQTLRAAADALLASDAGAPEVVLEPCEDCEVACDPGVLAIMVSNLLSNAAKFSADSPVRRVGIRCRPSADRVRVEVEDTGPGVPPWLEQAIFEPHVRAPGITKPGLGLGLATVKRYATACGGCVGVQRASHGGSIFWFEVPRAPAAPSRAAAPEAVGRAGADGRPPPGGKEVPV